MSGIDSEHRDNGVRLARDIENLAVRMQLQTSGARPGSEADVWRVERLHRTCIHVQPIAVNAIEADVGYIGESAVAREFDAVSAGSRLSRWWRRRACVLIDVKRIGQAAIRLDPERGNTSAAIVDGDGNPAARIHDDLVGSVSAAADFVQKPQCAGLVID